HRVSGPLSGRSSQVCRAAGAVLRARTLPSLSDQCVRPSAIVLGRDRPALWAALGYRTGVLFAQRASACCSALECQMVGDPNPNLVCPALSAAVPWLAGATGRSRGGGSFRGVHRHLGASGALAPATRHCPDALFG